MRRRVLLSAALAAPLVAPRGARAPLLPRAHAHNDYEHTRPLFDALDRGFTSVEADVYLVGGQLLVGHEPWDLRRSRTLTSLYLDPLRARAPGAPPVNLLVDVKTGAGSTWTRLDAVLRGYPGLLTTWTRGGDGTWTTREGAVTVVVTGNRAVTAMAAQSDRVAAVEGRAADAAGPRAPAFVPEIGVDWSLTFRWRGAGAMPATERDALRGLVTRAHAAGRRIRFYATPDAAGAARTAVWTELLAAGVDRINSDDLDGLARFLRSA